jgi:hypothetical protein
MIDMITEISTTKVQTMSTPEIAKITGIRHDNVMRTAKSLAEKGIIQFSQTEEFVKIGKGAQRVRKTYQFTGEQAENFLSHLTLSHAKQSKPSFVYLISDGEFVKIGIASSVVNRLKNLQTGNGRPLTILLSVKVIKPRSLEALLHGNFSCKRMTGEWFNLSKDELKIAKQIISEWGDE